MFIKKFFNKIREAHEERQYRKEEEYFKRTSTKNYRPEEEKPKFSDDYFKSSDDEAVRKEREAREREAREQAARQMSGEQPQEQPKENPRQQAAAEEQEEKPREARRTEYSNGITIIDDRDLSQANRKIFSSNEGEYTEFEEVN